MVLPDELTEAIIEHNEVVARPGQAGATTVVGRTPGGPVLGSGESQFMNWPHWSQGQVAPRQSWRLGRPELTFASEPRLKQIAGTRA